MKVTEAQQLCLAKNIPFYSYRLPGENDIFWGAQMSEEVKSFESMEDIRGTEGFVVVPFREARACPSLFIRRELAFVNGTADARLKEILQSASAKKSTPPRAGRGTKREEYDRRIRSMIDVLRQGRIRKMVLSRNIVVETEGYDLAPFWFDRLVQKYPDAFVFLVSVPGVMTWMGATPEIFLRRHNHHTETMALAGTRPLGETERWGHKEFEEQQIVSCYIAEILRDKGEWETAGPYTKQAGNVEHLCTSFTCTQQLTPALVDQIRRAMHPTPAVGGFPTGEAVKMIEETEGGCRRYYAGYLGPVAKELDFHWFVNLRSMEVFPHSVCLYVGGGITALSDPGREWEETELKSHTLLDIL